MDNPAQIPGTVLSLSALHVGLALVVFLRGGGRQFLFSGSFALGGALFFGFPGIVLAVLAPASLDSSAVSAAWLGLVGTLAVIGIAQAVARLRPRPAAGPHTESHGKPLLRLLLLAATVVTVGGRLAGLQLGPLPENTVYVAALVFFYDALQHLRSRSGGSAGPVGRWACLVALYGVLFFDGGGRLIAATFVYSHGILMALLLDSRWVKRAAVLGILPAMLVFGYIRSTTSDLAAVLSAAEGLNSMISPYQTLAMILPHVDAGHLATRGLDDLLSSLLFWVPRAVWPDKPYGFGFVLTLHYLPQLAAEGHSMAATYLGELYASARWLAVATGLVGVGGLVGWGDRVMLRAAARPGALGLVHSVILAILAAGMFDYVWVGSFTFCSRNVLRIAILIGCAAVARGLEAMITAGLADRNSASGRGP